MRAHKATGTLLRMCHGLVNLEEGLRGSNAGSPGWLYRVGANSGWLERSRAWLTRHTEYTHRMT